MTTASGKSATVRSRKAKQSAGRESVGLVEKTDASAPTSEGYNGAGDSASASASASAGASAMAGTGLHTRSTSLAEKLDGGIQQSTRRRKKTAALSGDEEDDMNGSTSALPSPILKGSEKATRLGGFLRPAGAGHEGLWNVLSSAEWKILAFIVVVALAIRLFRLSQPSSVVFDEVHFGGFAAKYIRSAYFMDVHPPLAKLLITAAAYLAGFDGTYDFKEIGKDYVSFGVPYVAMRLLPAALGIALVPLAFLTLRVVGCRTTTAILGSSFVIFENGLITQSRHVLLDSPLLFFTALTTFGWVMFAREERKPFTITWWSWLLLTGASLGAVASCKWVGLFTIATIGCCTLGQFWDLLGDLRVSPRLFMRHFVARALGLIVLPVLVYLFTFAIHFAILTSSGDGDGFMSSEFQHTLRGHEMDDTYADVAFGSKIVLKHQNSQGGYLHSHLHPYPGGSKQQQITLYPHRDENNDWIIVNQTDTIDYSTESPIHIEDRATIRLIHNLTQKRLHSHDVRPPITEVDYQNEVSAYGFEGFDGDANDYFVVEIEHGDRRDAESAKRIKTLRTKFRLRHLMTGCYLFSHKVKLPEWGFEQQEVTCIKGGTKPNAMWYIESNSHPMLGEHDEKVNYRKPGFFAKFWELQGVMWTTNAGLTDRHAYDSRPLSWPVLSRGINFWVKDNRQIYLLGNPFVWFVATAGLVVYGIAQALLILRSKRGYKDTSSTLQLYNSISSFFALGWALHYIPFFLMNRQLFLHHYFPALYFAILQFSSVFDFATIRLSPKTRLQVAGVVLLCSIYSFSVFSPLTYGNKWTKGECQKARLISTWDFDCNAFYNSYDQYDRRAAEGQDKASNQAMTLAYLQGKESAEGQPQPGQNVFQEARQPGAKESSPAAGDAPGFGLQGDEAPENVAAEAQRGFQAEPGILPEVLEEDPQVVQETPTDASGSDGERAGLAEGAMAHGEMEDPLPTPEAQIEDADTEGPVSPVETETVAAEAEDVKTASD